MKGKQGPVLFRYAYNNKDPLLNAMELMRVLSRHTRDLAVIISEGRHGDDANTEHELRLLEQLCDEVGDVCEDAHDLLQAHKELAGSKEVV